jgi:sterol desaturase/sphingolipid hydroxylase (fatty acid hydroxylase superfamily)
LPYTCRYHWDHHLKLNWNYSEIEFLDRMFGTLYVWEHEPDYLRAPRLNKKRPTAKVDSPSRTVWGAGKPSRGTERRETGEGQ